jgi:hypothetical protein
MRGQTNLITPTKGEDSPNKEDMAPGELKLQRWEHGPPNRASGSLILLYMIVSGGHLRATGRCISLFSIFKRYMLTSINNSFYYGKKINHREYQVILPIFTMEM